MIGVVLIFCALCFIVLWIVTFHHVTNKMLCDKANRNQSHGCLLLLAIVISFMATTLLCCFGSAGLLAIVSFLGKH